MDIQVIQGKLVPEPLLPVIVADTMTATVENNITVGEAFKKLFPMADAKDYAIRVVCKDSRGAPPLAMPEEGQILHDGDSLIVVPYNNIGILLKLDSP